MFTAAEREILRAELLERAATHSDRLMDLLKTAF